MMAVRVRPVRLVVTALLLAPVVGCAVVGSAFNPDLVNQLGLGGLMQASQGTVVVAFVNDTQFDAAFYAYESKSTVDLTQDSRNFFAVVGAGQVGNEVLSCPVGLISPGMLAADFTPDPVAASVLVATDTAVTTTDVSYQGPPVESGVAYACGDVVEIRLVPVSGGTAQQTNFAITVRVIKSQ
jgi:hypothetical protein